MKSSRKSLIFLLLILLSTTTRSDQSQKGNPSAGSLCVSDCETCPVVCAQPPSPPELPPPPPPPTPKHHHSPPAHPAPAEGDQGTPPPPALYVYTPVAPGMVQQNFSNPYYYFYASKAAKCSLSIRLGFVVFMLFVFFQKF